MAKQEVTGREKKKGKCQLAEKKTKCFVDEEKKFVQNPCFSSPYND